MPRKKPVDRAGPNCSHCLYWREKTGEADEVRWGECRRYPPTLFAATDENGDQIPWPMQTQTEPEDWCGEFRGGDA
jgi:hypothetical protein